MNVVLLDQLPEGTTYVKASEADVCVGGAVLLMANMLMDQRGGQAGRPEWNLDLGPSTPNPEPFPVSLPLGVRWRPQRKGVAGQRGPCLQLCAPTFGPRLPFRTPLPLPALPQTPFPHLSLPVPTMTAIPLLPSACAYP